MVRAFSRAVEYPASEFEAALVAARFTPAIVLRSRQTGSEACVGPFDALSSIVCRGRVERLAGDLKQAGFAIHDARGG